MHRYRLLALLLAAGCTAQQGPIPSSVNTAQHVDGNDSTRGVVANADVDTLIDPRLPPKEKALIHAALLRMAPDYRRYGVIVITKDGVVHASNLDFLRGAKIEHHQQQNFDKPITPEDRARALSMPPNKCPLVTFGNPGGAFRRVYTGCTGYIKQHLQFYANFTGNTQTDCAMSSYNYPEDSPYVLGGAYTVSGQQTGTGIDLGLQQTNYADKGVGWNSYAWYSKNNYGPYSWLPCGGIYDIWDAFSQVDQNTNEFSLTACYNFDNIAQRKCITEVDVQVPATVFLTGGSNFVFRRLTSIGQRNDNFNSGEWFGFASGGLGANLSDPEIAYSEDQLTLYGATQAVQIDSTNSYASRYPDDPNKVLCSHDKWNPGLPNPNFNDYEGIVLGAATTGILPGNPC